MSESAIAIALVAATATRITVLSSPYLPSFFVLPFVVT